MSATEQFTTFRFRAGAMRGSLVSDAPSAYIRQVLGIMHPRSETAIACRTELARRDAEAAPGQQVLVLSDRSRISEEANV